MFFQAPPFPEPPEIELAVVLATVQFIILIFMMLLMVYFHQKMLTPLPIITLYAFSLYLGLQFIQHGHPPISPFFEIFFLVFQTTMFVTSAVEIHGKIKR